MKTKFVQVIGRGRWISLLIVIIFLFFTAKIYQNNALSFHFVDEEDNIVLGHYLLQGEKLYSDLFSHHQPLAYMMSGGVQQVNETNTIFLLIKKHREAIIIWACLWSILLVIRFGWPLLVFIGFFEILKFFLLGHLFLSESIVVYPFVYLISWVSLKKNLYKGEIVFLGTCFVLSFFLLSPLWPVLIFLLLVVLYQTKYILKNAILLLIGAFPILLLMLQVITIKDYLYNAFFINFKYYIPIASQQNAHTTLFNAFLAPLISLTMWQDRSATLQIIQIFSFLFLVNSILLLMKKKINLIILIFIILGLANLRYVIPGTQSYSGFHILPWFAGLLVLDLISLQFVWSNYSKAWIKFVTVFLLLGAFLITLKEVNQSLFPKKDINKDYYINYSRQADIGQAIKIMKEESETLFVVPDEWLIYWQADIKHFSRMVNYYAWMSTVPEIKEPLHIKFLQEPPTYFYCDRCDFGYYGLEAFFPLYSKVKKDGGETKLFVLKEKVKQISKEQADNLQFYNFEVN